MYNWVYLNYLSDRGGEKLNHIDLDNLVLFMVVGNVFVFSFINLLAALHGSINNIIGNYKFKKLLTVYKYTSIQRTQMLCYR